MASPSATCLSAYDAFYSQYQVQNARQAARDTLRQQLDGAESDLKQAKADSRTAWQTMVASMAADHPGLEVTPPATADQTPPSPVPAPAAAPADPAGGAAAQSAATVTGTTP